MILIGVLCVLYLDKEGVVGWESAGCRADLGVGELNGPDVPSIGISTSQ
jgi:hypothetical protein